MQLKHILLKLNNKITINMEMTLKLTLSIFGVSKCMLKLFSTKGFFLQLL